MYPQSRPRRLTCPGSRLLHLGKLLYLVALCAGALARCTSSGAAPDAGGVDAEIGPGLFDDCSPGPDQLPCQPGLRCDLVQVGTAPYQGWLTQCVPVAAAPLAANAACAYDQTIVQPAGQMPKLYDRCAAGLACVTVPAAGLRCRSLCPQEMIGVCGGAELCLLPSPVASIGYCAAPDGCDPVKQTGCPKGPTGAALSCYVLSEEALLPTDMPKSATYCLLSSPLSDSSGAAGSQCMHQLNCQPGLGCVDVTGTGFTQCQPYCDVPLLDGGIPDAGNPANAPCDGPQTTCHAIATDPGVGFCF